MQSVWCKIRTDIQAVKRVKVVRMKEDEDENIAKTCDNCRKYKRSIGRCQDIDWNCYVPKTDTCWKWERRRD